MSSGEPILQATATGPRTEAVGPPTRRIGFALPAVTNPQFRGWLPSQGAVVVLLAALGLGLCAWCEDLSRATLAPNPWIYWVGIILIVAPICYRLTAFSMSSGERVSLVVIEGLALYVARMLRDPYGFTLTDEFMHAYNINQIIHTHHLYGYNPLLPISAHFPGLEAATSAIAELTGMSSWGSGVVLIGASRVMLMLALYGLFTAISRSARVGALGAAVFAGNSQFLIFEGQFAYESLALPLLIVLLAAIAERQRSSVGSRSSRAWSVMAVLTIIAIVPTHHLTAYVMVICLWLLCLFQGWAPPGPLRRLKMVPGPAIWPFALMATLLTLAWLVVVASQTVGYLSPEIGSAFAATLRTVTGDGNVRGFFSNSGASVGSVNLKSEEAVSFLEPVLLLCALPFGTIALWRKKQWTPFVGLCAVMGIAYLGLSAMRVVPSAWEVGNRGAEFAFFGFAYLVGVTTLAFTARFWRFRVARAAVGIGIGLCVVGGAVAGWPANTRLSLPTEIKVSDGATLYSESEAVARWFATQPKGRVIAGDADALLIGDASGDPAFFDFTYHADAILSTPSLAGANSLPALRKANIRYVVVDLRKSSQDATTGVYFNLSPPVAPIGRDYNEQVLTKWEPLAARVYDSGDIVVFDLDRKP